VKILVADDSKAIRKMLRALLEDVGHEVAEAADGAEALRVLESPNPPELAILDWTMPFLDGPEICARLRSSHADVETYLILLTVKNGRTDTLAGLRCGANDYVTKPFDEEALLARVQIGGQMMALQRSLAARVTDLEKTNQELDAFSRMVAHDLRSPLAAANGFLGLIESDHWESLNHGTRSCISEIKGMAQQMDRTILDLLNLARATRGDLICAPLDLAELAREWVETQGRQPQAGIVEFHCPAALPAHGDAGLMKLAVQNLLGNAWKFSARATRPRVEFKAVEHNGVMTYSISDNGVGFNMANARRLFTPFQRLHSQNDFVGTGIGLTIVRRIVERHGGNIRAEAAPGQGATFQFTLGQQAPASLQREEMSVRSTQETTLCP
jgi:signal transduction histidine kinase